MSDLILAFDGDLATVRIVDSNGGLLPNLYVQSGHAVGPTLPYSQLGDIRADLASNLPIHVLRALVFLSGEHRNPSLPRDAEPVRDPEWRTASLLHAFFETDPSVRRAVQRLAQSSQPWIRKQAQETLQRFRSTSVPRP